ncbi:carbon-nitrogen family hydrolase [Candidatus Clostridium radicumherbarum]|uniref:Carbon-nitrogen family hydrolase n=1 Tax=Candidatus Clostridium radicumherbarum TaxID=3381662 RepID=A0ABW8TQB3_9CLOT
MKIALAQMRVEFENKEKNKEKCWSFIKGAKDKSCDLIIFPEMTLTGFSMNTKEIAEDNNETINWFKDKALNYGLYIGFGHVVRVNEKCENRFTIVSPDNKEILSYAKIHPFSYSFEDKYYVGGNSILYTHIRDFMVSPFICYDLRFPEIFQIASKECHLITVAANWPKSRRDNWITLLKARAIENQCYIAGVNVMGRINGYEYYGDSLIIDPIGNIIAVADDKEELLIAEIDINEVLRFRDHFPIKRDRREELYKDITAKKCSEAK